MNSHIKQSMPAGPLFSPPEPKRIPFPIQAVVIDWDRLLAKRPLLLKNSDEMPGYLLKPEVVNLLKRERDPMHRLILNLMWVTGARISEVLALTPASFHDDGYDYQVILKTLKRKAGRPRKGSLLRSPKRTVPIVDPGLRSSIEGYLFQGQFRKNDRIFKVARQTVNRHLAALVAEAGGAPFRISSHTLRHSFAIHLLLHGRPLKIISQLLWHRSVASTEIYTKVLAVDSAQFLDGIEF